jgi:hypothetical protein
MDRLKTLIWEEKNSVQEGCKVPSLQDCCGLRRVDMPCIQG